MDCIQISEDGDITRTVSNMLVLGINKTYNVRNIATHVDSDVVMVSLLIYVLTEEKMIT